MVRTRAGTLVRRASPARHHSHRTHRTPPLYRARPFHLPIGRLDPDPHEPPDEAELANLGVDDLGLAVPPTGDAASAILLVAAFAVVLLAPILARDDEPPASASASASIADSWSARWWSARWPPIPWLARLLAARL